MSDIASPESATAPFAASSAWAASGISAERVTFEKPTPLTATLHRCSHMPIAPPGLRAARETELRQRDVVVQRLEDDFHPPPALRLPVGRLQQIAGQQGPGAAAAPPVALGSGAAAAKPSAAAGSRAL